jgi:hypothetical protein
MRNLCEVWYTSFLQHTLLSGAKDKRVLSRNYNMVFRRMSRESVELTHVKLSCTLSIIRCQVDETMKIIFDNQHMLNPL